MNLTFENDEEGLAGIEREQWLIRDLDTDNADIIAVIPKTGDEEYDDQVTYPNVKLLTAAPKLLQAVRSAHLFLRGAFPSGFHNSEVDDLFIELENAMNASGIKT